MDPLTGLLIGGGSLLGSGLGLWGQSSANSANMEQAIHTTQANRDNMYAQMDYQTRMSNSAYQRQVQDMRKAGINPIAAFGSGGASVPTGGSASGGAGATMQNTVDGDAISKAVSSGYQAARSSKEMENTDSQIALNHAAEIAKKADTVLSENSAKKVEADTANAQLQSEALQAKLPAIRAEARTAKQQADIDSKMMNYDNTTKRISEGVGIVGKAVDALNPGKIIRGIFKGPDQTPPPGGIKGMRQEQFKNVMKQRYGVD